MGFSAGPLAEASVSAPLTVSEPVDPLALSFQDLIASSPKSNEEEDFSTTTSAETQQKLDECLTPYGSGLPTWSRNMEQFNRLRALLLDLVDQPDFHPAGKCFAKTLSLCLSFFLT